MHIVPGGLAIVLPVLNEASLLPRQLQRLDDLPGVDELIIVDGGSSDATCAIARAHPRAQLLHAPRGRAAQMNAGAAAATSHTLLFLHADVTLPQGAALWIRHALADPHTPGGAFRTWTLPDHTLWWAPLLHLADLRSRYTRLPYGDQALFVRAHLFHELGGFPVVPLLEDLELSQQLQQRGELALLPACVEVSGRRFVARPLYYTLLDNLIPALRRTGVSLDTLAAWYDHIR